MKLRVTPWRGQIGSSWTPATSSDTYFQNFWVTIILAALLVSWQYGKANAARAVNWIYITVSCQEGNKSKPMAIQQTWKWMEMDCLTDAISSTPHLLTHAGKNRHRSMKRSASWRSWTEFLRLFDVCLSQVSNLPNPKTLSAKVSKMNYASLHKNHPGEKQKLARVTRSKTCRSDPEFWTKCIVYIVYIVHFYMCLFTRQLLPSIRATALSCLTDKTIEYWKNVTYVT